MSTLQKFCVFAMLNLATLNAQAAVVTKDCPACSIKQIAALAKPCSQGYSYITNFPAGKLYKVCFTVKDGEKIFDWQKPEAQAQQLFDAYNNVYKLNGHHQYINARVRVDIPTINGVAVPPADSSH